MCKEWNVYKVHVLPLVLEGVIMKEAVIRLSAQLLQPIKIDCIFKNFLETIIVRHFCYPQFCYIKNDVHMHNDISS